MHGRRIPFRSRNWSIKRQQRAISQLVPENRGQFLKNQLSGMETFSNVDQSKSEVKISSREFQQAWRGVVYFSFIVI